MRVTASSQPGSPDHPNEDAIAVGRDTVAVLDGATARTDTGCIHGVAWFVEHLAEAIAENSDQRPAHALAIAIRQTADRHRSTCDLEHPGTPSAAIGIAQARRGVLHYLLLGDVTLVIDTADGLRVLNDNRVAGTALAERAVADALPSGSPDKNQALVKMKFAELSSRNVAGGFWVAAADPSIVTNALTGMRPLREARRVALLSDGAARAVEPLQLYDWSEVFQVLSQDGAEELIRRVRASEANDPAGIRWPRNKIHDDATAALVEY